MKLKITWTNRLKKDYKLAIKRNRKISELDTVIRMLANGDVLPCKYNDHALTGNWNGYRECHIQADWLLIYKVTYDTLILTLTRTGTHTDLFT